MFLTIGTDEMRKKMGEILDCVRLRGDEFIIERKNRPVAALIPIAKLEAMEKAARSFLLDHFLQEEGVKISDKEIEELLDEAKSETRKTTRGSAKVEKNQ